MAGCPLRLHHGLDELSDQMTKKRKKRRRSGSKRNRWTFARVRNILLTLLFLLLLWRILSPGSFSSALSWIGITSEISSNGFDGIDVSKHNGKIDWKEVSDNSNIQFVYIKASEGGTLGDRRYARNIKEARNAGLKVGSYHFFTSTRSAKEQFENFRKRVNKSQQDLIPMIDVEEKGNRGCNREKLQASLKELTELMKAEYGKYPLIYSGHDFYNAYLAPEFNRHYLFLARYGGDKPQVKGGGKWNIWQYSETGRIKGIKGKVDLDRFATGTTIRDIMY